MANRKAHAAHFSAHKSSRAKAHCLAIVLWGFSLNDVVSSAKGAVEYAVLTCAHRRLVETREIEGGKRERR